MRRLTFLSLLLAAVLFPGCLETKEAILGRYDAPRDTFVFLNLYQRIGGEKPEDFDYLADLYANRAHLLTPPMPNILGKTSYLRLSPHEYATLNLGDRKSLETEKTDLPLDQITVKPGKFFLRGQDNLCYYDQIEVPGPFVDALLTQLNSKAAPDLIRDLGNELDRRRDGGKTFTWAQLRAANSEATKTQPAGAPSDELKPSPITCASTDTLKRLRDAALEGSVGIKRDKSVFRLVIPAADDDVKEMKATLDSFKADLAEQIKAPDHEKDLESQLAVLNVLEVKPLGNGKVEFSADTLKLFPQLPSIFDPQADLGPPASAEAAIKYKNAVTAIRSKEIPIDEKITVDQIIAQFNTGALPAALPDKPAPAGHGLVDGR